jgi:hypothetical protein
VIRELSRRRELGGNDRPERRTQLRGALDAEARFESRLRLRPGLERFLEAFFTGFGQVEFLGAPVGCRPFDPNSYWSNHEGGPDAGNLTSRSSTLSGWRSAADGGPLPLRWAAGVGFMRGIGNPTPDVLDPVPRTPTMPSQASIRHRPACQA